VACAPCGRAVDAARELDPRDAAVHARAVPGTMFIGQADETGDKGVV
jgi:hypothetical protein